MLENRASGFLMGGPPGAAVGLIVGGATGTGFLKARNLWRGWTRITSAHSTGMENIHNFLVLCYTEYNDGYNGAN